MISKTKKNHQVALSFGEAITAENAQGELSVIFDNLTVGLVLSRNGKIARANLLAAELLDYGAECIGRNLNDFFATPDDFFDLGAQAQKSIAQGLPWQMELPLRKKNNGELWCRISGLAIDRNNASTGALWIIEDVSDRRRLEAELAAARAEMEQRVISRTAELATANERLQREIEERSLAEQRVWHMAHHDALTGLPNRSLLMARLSQSLSLAQRHKSGAAVMFIDLDRFKKINDTLGHHVGDELLKQVADRLSGVIRAVDTVARLGGDEFVIVLGELAGPRDAVLVAEKVIASLAKPIVVEGQTLHTTPSIGISIYPEHGDDSHTLMKNADTAMYRAKSSGRNRYEFFTTEMNTEVERIFSIEHRLRAAMENNRMRLYYQPIFDFAKQSVCAIEALLRWQDEDGSMIEPRTFLIVAEETDLIVPIGQWVLRNALRQNKLWQDAGYPRLPICVNLSLREFRQFNLVDQIATILKEVGQPADLLEIEISESILMHEGEGMSAKLAAFAELGVRVSINDFGIGYSNFGFLKRNPVKRIKVDKSFVRDLKNENKSDIAIIDAIGTLARGLGIEAVAVGVENEQQMAVLLGCGCTRFQGSHFLPATAPEQVERIFRPLQR